MAYSSGVGGSRFDRPNDSFGTTTGSLTGTKASAKPVEMLTSASVWPISTTWPRAFPLKIRTFMLRSFRCGPREGLRPRAGRRSVAQAAQSVSGLIPDRPRYSGWMKSSAEVMFAAALAPVLIPMQSKPPAMSRHFAQSISKMTIFFFVAASVV